MRQSFWMLFSLISCSWFIFPSWSEVFPAVFDSELGVAIDIVTLSWKVWDDFGPAPLFHMLRSNSVGNITIWFFALKSHGLWLVGPFGDVLSPWTVSICLAPAWFVIKGQPVTPPWSTLHTEGTPGINTVLNWLGVFIVVPLVILFLLYPLVKIAPCGRPVFPPRLRGSVPSFACQNKRSRFTGRFFSVEVHASIWLHSSGMWLSSWGYPYWCSVTFSDFNIEVNVWVKWDWLSSERCLGVSSSISVVWWAADSCFSSLFQLRNCEIPTVEDFSWSKIEGFWCTTGFRSGVSDFSAILKISSPMYCSPVTNLASRSISFLSYCNSDSREIVVSRVVGITFTVWSIYIWTTLGLSCYCLGSV